MTFPISYRLLKKDAYLQFGRPSGSFLPLPPHKQMVMGSIPEDDTNILSLRFQSFVSSNKVSPP